MVKKLGCFSELIDQAFHNWLHWLAYALPVVPSDEYREVRFGWTGVVVSAAENGAELYPVACSDVVEFDGVRNIDDTIRLVLLNGSANRVPFSARVQLEALNRCSSVLAEVAAASALKRLLKLLVVLGSAYANDVMVVDDCVFVRPAVAESRTPVLSDGELPSPCRM